jgi:hypothetical protein
VSCCLEAAATPLLDVQSDPDIQGYWPGLEQVIIRDYMAADSLKPHFGVGDMPLVAINCSLNSIPDPTTEPGESEKKPAHITAVRPKKRRRLGLTPVLYCQGRLRHYRVVLVQSEKFCSSSLTQ